jgi:hypothetical protein
MENHRNHKCVIVLKSGLPIGFAANAAAVLAISIGQRNPQVVAQDLLDGSGCLHAGLVNVPVPVLQANEAELKLLRDAAFELNEVEVVDFSEPARTARTFDEYRELLGKTEIHDLQYVGVALMGNKSEISRLTANFTLLK